VSLREVKPDGTDAGLAQLIEIGTSAGGACAKAVVGWNPRTEAFLSGQLGIPEGFEPWTIKIDTTGSGDTQNTGQYGRIEYAYYLMAKACGIDISSSQLCEVGGRAHFMTKRFDRGANNTKHHVQTLCAMKGMDYNALRVHDYVQLFIAAGELGPPYEAHDELFRRMVFNVAFSNTGDHTNIPNADLDAKEFKTERLAKKICEYRLTLTSSSMF